MKDKNLVTRFGMAFTSFWQYSLIYCPDTTLE